MSEKTLDHFIERIKTEAIEKAERTAQSIISEAEKKAAVIISEAQHKKALLIEDGQREAEALTKGGENALRQALRDIIISLQNDLMHILGSILQAEIRQSFSPDLIRTTIIQVIKNIGGKTEIRIADSIKEELALFIQSQLQNSEEIPKITGENRVLDAFTISRTDEGWHYNISVQEVSELLYSHLAPKWNEILNRKKMS